MLRVSLWGCFAIVLVACGGRRARGGPGDGGVDAPDWPVGTEPPADAPMPPCEPDIVVPFLGTACSYATTQCVSGCATGDCYVTCLEADPNPDCIYCVNSNLISCVNDLGCQREWNAFVCCMRANCPEGGCAETACGVPNRARVDCGTAVISNCGSVDDSCFALM